MKIVLIHGQNHKGSTYHIGRKKGGQVNNGLGNEKRRSWLGQLSVIFEVMSITRSW